LTHLATLLRAMEPRSNESCAIFANQYGCRRGRRRPQAPHARPHVILFGTHDLPGVNARLQQRGLLSRRLSFPLFRNGGVRGLGELPPRRFPRGPSVFHREFGAATGFLCSIYALCASGFNRRVEESSALPSGRSGRNRHAGGRFLVLQRQDRIGDLGGSSRWPFPAATRRIATAVTCPIISASAG
jgi:hypothetical protein